MKPLEAVSPDYHGGRRYCDKYKELVKMYCFDCQINVCSMCCLESHKTHKFERIDVAQEFARSIDEEIEQATSHIESFISDTAQTEAENSKLLSSIHATEREIKNKGEEVKQSFARRIDSQVSDLLDELQSMKSAAEKEVKKSRTDAVQLARTELESFRTSSLELKSKGSPSDIVQAAGDVRVRASELLQKHVIPAEYLAPSFQFAPADTDDLLTDDRNFIGDLATDTGMQCSFLPSTSFNRDDLLWLVIFDSNE